MSNIRTDYHSASLNNMTFIIKLIVHGLGTEVHPPPPALTLREWYHFVQGNDTNQNIGVPIDLL